MVSARTARPGLLGRHPPRPSPARAGALSTPRFSVEVLEKRHQRDNFDCGSDALNRYIRTQARQEMERDVAIAYVLVPHDQPARIAGYHSLSSTAVRLSEWPEPTRKRLPRYPL